MRRLRTLAFAVVLSTVLLRGASAATAQTTIIVGAGDSIQAAVDRAQPGTLIQIEGGTYSERVTVRTDGLTLQGFGIQRTFIDGRRVDADDGLTILGAHNVTVERLTVRNFDKNEIVIGDPDRPGSGGSGHVLREAMATGAAVYGISVVHATDVRLIGNSVTDNMVGLHIAQSPDCRCVVASNAAFENHSLGILISEAGNVRLEGNEATENDVGIAALQAGPGLVLVGNELQYNGQGILLAATDGALVFRNQILDNNRQTTTPEEFPGGYGLVLRGSSHGRVTSNTLSGHERAGIHLAEQIQWGGGSTSGDNLLCPNTMVENEVDITSDDTGHANRPYCITLSYLFKP